VQPVEQRHEVRAIDPPAALVAAAEHASVVRVEEHRRPRPGPARNRDGLVEVDFDRLVGSLRQPHEPRLRALVEPSDRVERRVERQRRRPRLDDEQPRVQPAIDLVVERDHDAGQRGDEQRDREHDPAPPVQHAPRLAGHPTPFGDVRMRRFAVPPGSRRLSAG
jgi:hypothetical protein